MRCRILILLCVVAVCGLTARGNATNQNLPARFVAKTASRDIPAQAVRQMIGQLFPSAAAQLDSLPAQAIRVDAITYRTVDSRGDSITASGIISYPLDIDVRGVAVGLHSTVLADAQAPSSMMFQPELALSLGGYAVVMPDYIGYGATKERTHPYLHVSSTGRVAADMLFAAWEYLLSIEKPVGRAVTALGYSQGGHATLAFEKIAEQEHAGRIVVDEVFAGGGAYDLIGTVTEFVQTDSTGYPCSLPYVAIGMDCGENLNLDYSKVFLEPLLSNYKEWYDSKTYTSKQVNGLLGTGKVSAFMHNDLFTPARNTELDKLYASMERNSLLAWKPQAKVHLIHATGDTYVPLLNAQNALKSYQDKGCRVLLTTCEGNHIEGFGAFYTYVFKHMK